MVTCREETDRLNCCGRGEGDAMILTVGNFFSVRTTVAVVW